MNSNGVAPKRPTDASSPSRRWWQAGAKVSRLAAAREVARLASAAGGAFAAAGLGAVLAIWFPAESELTWPLIATGFGLLILVVATITVSKMNARNGTLYYVRHQFPGMADWHADDLSTLIARRPLDFRVLGREVIPNGNYREILDVTDGIASLADSFENQTNVDDASTGFDLAPDLQWFSAFTFGSQIYGQWENQRLHELPDHGPGQSPPPGIEWDLRRPPEHLNSHSVTIEVEKSHDDDPYSVVLVSANLTRERGRRPGEVRCRPKDWALAAWYGVGDFSTTSDTTVTHKTEYREVTVGHPKGTPTSANLIDPWEATAFCVMAIRRAAYDYPDKPILLSLAVPKTVAVAVGWHLLRDGFRAHTHDDLPNQPRRPTLIRRRTKQHAQSPLPVGLSPLAFTRNGHPLTRDVSPITSNLWQQLVPLYFDGRDFHPVRTHRSQPPAELILARLNKARRIIDPPTS